MWMALSKIAVCFMTAYGRGIDAARRLLGPYAAQRGRYRPEWGTALMADSVFRVRHRDENGVLSKERYLHRLRRYRQSWLKQLEQGTLLC